jgi:hypothetical protein
MTPMYGLIVVNANGAIVGFALVIAASSLGCQHVCDAQRRVSGHALMYVLVPISEE